MEVHLVSFPDDRWDEPPEEHPIRIGSEDCLRETCNSWEDFVERTTK